MRLVQWRSRESRRIRRCGKESRHRKGLTVTRPLQKSQIGWTRQLLRCSSERLGWNWRLIFPSLVVRAGGSELGDAQRPAA